MLVDFPIRQIVIMHSLHLDQEGATLYNTVCECIMIVIPLCASRKTL